MNLTRHARKRMQQRGIPDPVDAYLVCTEDAIATVGHLCQRVVRH